MFLSSLLAFACVCLACFCLFKLMVIDLKIRLLPNVWVGTFAVSALVFHLATGNAYLSWQSAGIGALMGGGLLLLIRTAGNYHYKQDTLGLGDVKLMAAAGIWLGMDHIMMAIVIGALAGLLHGGVLILKNRTGKGEKASLSTFSLPAGPGFIVGIVAAALVKYGPVSHTLFS